MKFLPSLAEVEVIALAMALISATCSGLIDADSLCERLVESASVLRRCAISFIVLNCSHIFPMYIAVCSQVLAAFSHFCLRVGCMTWPFGVVEDD